MAIGPFTNMPNAFKLVAVLKVNDYIENLEEFHLILLDFQRCNIYTWIHKVDNRLPIWFLNSGPVDILSGRGLSAETGAPFLHAAY